jgi:hypothetical protein
MPLNSTAALPSGKPSLRVPFGARSSRWHVHHLVLRVVVAAAS